MSTEPTQSGGRPLTGRKVLVIALVAFGVIIAANLAMLLAATQTFPGLVVKNSYVASQQWNTRTDAQRALGWQARADYSKGTLRVTMTGRDGNPVVGLQVVAVVGRPATTQEDRSLDLVEDAQGYALPLDLTPGRWRIDIIATDSADGKFEAVADILIKAAS